LEKVEPQVGWTSSGNPLIRVGCSVIAARRSEHTIHKESMVRYSPKASELWKKTNWKKLQRSLFRLQVRVWKAIRAGDKRKAKSLQKLILKSYAARMLAVRQVTQLNAGKRTAGVDGKASLTFFERLNLSNWLSHHYNNWRCQKLREIPIPKKDGKNSNPKSPNHSG